MAWPDIALAESRPINLIHIWGALHVWGEVHEKGEIHFLKVFGRGCRSLHLLRR